MKNLRTKMLKKIMPIFLAVIMVFNFIMPNYVYAADFGGVLFKPIAELLCGIGDIAIEILQNTFVTAKTKILQSAMGIPTYIIRYSPGIIFSGEIPVFDINFIEPKPAKEKKKYTISEGKKINEEIPSIFSDRDALEKKLAEIIKDYGGPDNFSLDSLSLRQESGWAIFWHHNTDIFFMWENRDKQTEEDYDLYFISLLNLNVPRNSRTNYERASRWRCSTV